MSGTAGTFAGEGSPEVLVLRVDGLEVFGVSFEGGVVCWSLDWECEAFDPLQWQRVLGVQERGKRPRFYVRVCRRRRS